MVGRFRDKKKVLLRETGNMGKTQVLEEGTVLFGAKRGEMKWEVEDGVPVAHL